VLQCVAVCCTMLLFVGVYGVCCRVLQCVVVCCSVLQCGAVCCIYIFVVMERAKPTALFVLLLLYCNTLQHTATHRNTLQHTATHCNTLNHNLQRYSCCCCCRHVYTCMHVYIYMYIYRLEESAKSRKMPANICSYTHTYTYILHM